MEILCTIYKSQRTEELYLYVRFGNTLDELPEALANEFSARTEVMTLNISSEKKLARADAARVIEAIEQQGYYLQMPPGKDTVRLEADARNELLPR